MPSKLLPQRIERRQQHRARQRECAPRRDARPVCVFLERVVVQLLQREDFLPLVAREIRRAIDRLSRVRSDALQPFTELAQRARVVVVPVKAFEERVQVHIRIERNPDEELGILLCEGRNRARRRLQVALLVTAHILRIHVQRQRARKLRCVLRPRQVLQVVVGIDVVLLIPLAVVAILLELVVDVPIRNVTRCIGPDPAIEREEDRYLRPDAPRDRDRQRVLGDWAPHLLAARAAGVEVGIELPVTGATLRRPQVEDRHADASLHRVTDIRRIDRSHRC